MTDEPEYQTLAATLQADAVLDGDANLKAAFLQINLKTFQISFCWLPELFFVSPMPEPLRAAIVKRLCLQADKLESGELERQMQSLANINDPPGNVDSAV